MKKTISCINHIIDKIHKNNKLAKNISPLLKNGLYFYDRKTQTISRKRKGLKDILLNAILIFSFKKIEKNSYLIIKKGYVKELVALNSKSAFCFYNSNNYAAAKNNILKYSTTINYPVAKYLSFNDKKQIITLERVKSIKNVDDFDFLIVESLLIYASTAKYKFVNGKYLYLQHGDIKKENIIWTSNNSFIFIDLDFCGYKPILYDVIHYLSTFFQSLSEILSILEKYKRQISLILHKFDMNFSQYYLDQILSEYINFSPIEDCQFLNNCSTMSNYPKTNASFKNKLSEFDHSNEKYLDAFFGNTI